MNNIFHLETTKYFRLNF